MIIRRSRGSPNLVSEIEYAPGIPYEFDEDVAFPLGTDVCPYLSLPSGGMLFVTPGTGIKVLVAVDQAQSDSVGKYRRLIVYRLSKSSKPIKSWHGKLSASDISRDDSSWFNALIRTARQIWRRSVPRNKPWHKVGIAGNAKPRSRLK